MKNKKLIKMAVLAGFEEEKCARINDENGEEAVQLPRDIQALERLELLVPTLKSVKTNEFHYWLVRG